MQEHHEFKASMGYIYKHIKNKMKSRNEFNHASARSLHEGYQTLMMEKAKMTQISRKTVHIYEL